IDNYGLAIVYPIFSPLFLNPHLELLGTHFTFFHRTLLLGLLIASFPLAQFFGAPFIGAFSDRVGRRKMFIVTISGGIIGYIMTGLGIHFQEIHLLWIGRVLAGFFAGNLTLCLAAIADITAKKGERTRNFGWVGTLGGLGFVLAIFAGGSLSNPNLNAFFHPEIPFFLTGFLSAVNLCLIIHFYKESHTVKPHDKIAFFKALKNIKTAITTKQVRAIYFAYFFFIVCWFTSMQFLSAYLLTDYSVSLNVITFAFIMIAITWSLANFLINPLLSRIVSPSKTFFMGMLFLSIFLYLTLIPHQPLFLFLIHFFVITLCAALSWTNGLATISINVSKWIQGSILGVNQSIVAIASIVGPIIGGILAGIDIHKLYLFTATCSLVGALLYFIHLLRIKKV
ncbi:MAG: hypothetical protein K1000chlam2_00707, partial [Chlamydiae bacterium]|nr:hypothetical protein [Chlamydiota bacterium]